MQLLKGSGHAQDYAAEHFKNAGLQDDLNRMRDQHPIEIASLRDAATIERAAQLSVLRQEAATALTLVHGEARALAVAPPRECIRDCA